jgi:hypothetical protein
MPLIETLGSGGAKGFGLNSGGKNAFSLKSVYSSATLYAPLNDNSIYLSGSKSGLYFVTKAATASFTVDPLLNRDVLQNPSPAEGKVETKINRSNINISPTHSISIWHRSRTGDSAGMLFSKYGDGDATSGSSPLDIWDGGGTGGDIINNTGDGSATPFVDNGEINNWKSTSWVHWCFTYDGSTARMYKNGSLMGSTAGQYKSFNGTNSGSGNGSWAIGSWAGPYAGDYWLPDSNFADFAWFNGTVLNSTQVASIYSAGVRF